MLFSARAFRFISILCRYNSHEWGRKWGGAFASLDLVYHFPPDTLPGFNKYYDQISGLQANVMDRAHPK